ncbi:hypothetical protein D3C79_1060620 [compost metagenome]
MNCRVTITCSAVTISAAAVTGSLAEWGAEPWPPAPSTVTTRPSEELSMTPGLVTNCPCGSSEEKTCIP